MTKSLVSTFLPCVDWLKTYNTRTFSDDLLAAVIVTIMLVPQSLAYALLAGVPAEGGLYASILPLVLSTVFGSSPRLRTDIMLNNFLLNAHYNKKITIVSDGLPWRPVLHVQDLCNVIKNLIINNYRNINGKAFNIGLNGGNYKVVDLAIKVLKKLKNVSAEITNTHGKDQRTYKVSFKRIYNLCGKKIITKSVNIK